LAAFYGYERESREGMNKLKVSSSEIEKAKN
jgi:hypothetical protein